MCQRHTICVMIVMSIRILEPVRGSPLVATECPDDFRAALLINISSTFFFGQKKKVAKKSCLRRWHFILLKNGHRTLKI